MIAGAVWAIEIFTLGYRRYALAANMADAGESKERLLSAIKEPGYNQILKWLFLGLLIPLLYFAIRRSMDFAVILSIATLVSGVIYGLDTLILKRFREKLLAHVEDRYTSDEEVRQTVAAEPELIEYSRSFFPVLLIVLALRSFMIEPYQIPSSSMEPTLLVGDFIAVNKWAYGLRVPVLGTEIVPIGKPNNGDMIVFKPPHEPSRTFIKRVVGIPGDHVRYDRDLKVVYLNGEPLLHEEQEFGVDPNGRKVISSYTEQLGDITHLVQKLHFQSDSAYHSSVSNPEGFTVPEGKYFVLGDNRDQSADSRYWGFVEENAILGKAFAIWMHWSSGFPSFGRVGMVD